MLIKHLLSIISVIAVSKITKTLATAKNTDGMVVCGSVEVTNLDVKEPCNLEGTDSNKYCISEGTIYRIDGDTTTQSACAIGKDGIYAFTSAGSNTSASRIILGSSGSSTPITADELMLYRCSYGVDNTLACERTYGYALIDDNVYTVKKDGTVNFDTLDNIKGGAADCTDESHLGTIIKGGKLCLNDSSKITSSNTIDENLSTPKHYIMANKEGNIFTGAESDNKNIIWEARTNVIVLDTDVYDYCVTAAETSNSVTPTFKEFCDNNTQACGIIAEVERVESGPVWKREDDVPGCIIGSTPGSSSNCITNGYYMARTVSGGTPITGGSGVLFQCTAANTCVQISKVGYFKYANKDKYIKCDSTDNCVTINITSGANGCNDRENNDAKYTNGAIINNGYNDILCLDNTVAGGITISGGNNGKEFFAPNGSIFLSGQENKYAKVKVAKSDTDISVTLSNRGNINGYYHADANSLEIITGVGPAALFKCEAALGLNCAKISNIGYFKYDLVENKYIKCTAADTCTEIDVHVSATSVYACNDVGIENGDIIYDGTDDILCLDNSVDTGIAISTDNDGREYFVKDGSVFLTGASGKYAKVTVKNSNGDLSIALSPRASTGNAATYIYSDNLLKIYARSDKTGVCSTNEVIVEFKYSSNGSNSDLYEKKVEYKWRS